MFSCYSGVLNKTLVAYYTALYCSTLLHLNGALHCTLIPPILQCNTAYIAT